MSKLHESSLKLKMITFENLSIEMNKKTLLKSANINFPEVGIVLITGENGCGKSTLLKNLALKFSKKLFHRNRLSFVSSLQLYESSIPILGKEFYALYSNKKWSEDLFSKFGKLLEQRIDRMSSGEFQALILISNMMSESEILFFDEPVSHLSSDWSQYFVDWFKKEKSKKLIIVVSHQLDHFNNNIDEHLIFENQKLNSQILSKQEYL